MITRLIWIMWSSISDVREWPCNLITHSLTRPHPPKISQQIFAWIGMDLNKNKFSIKCDFPWMNHYWNEWAPDIEWKIFDIFLFDFSLCCHEVIDSTFLILLWMSFPMACDRCLFLVYISLHQVICLRNTQLFQLAYTPLNQGASDDKLSNRCLYSVYSSLHYMIWLITQFFTAACIHSVDMGCRW